MPIARIELVIDVLELNLEIAVATMARSSGLPVLTRPPSWRATQYPPRKTAAIVSVAKSVCRRR